MGLERFKSAFAEEDYGRAYAAVVEALKRDPAGAWRGIVQECSYPFVRVVSNLEREAEIAELLDALYATAPEMIVISTDVPAATTWRRMNIEKGLPYYLFVPQAKSGSFFLGDIIPHGFSLPCVTYAAINLRVVLSWARECSRGGACYLTHLLPSPDNLRLLREAGLNRLVVNTRDPRQLFLSGLHHVARYPDGFPEFGPSYFDLPIDQQAIIHLPNYLSTVVGWLAGWVDAADRGGLDILFTTYERVRANRDTEIERMLAFYGGDLRHFDRDRANSVRDDIDYHYRKGETDEWREAFSPELQAKLTQPIPTDWFARFGWRP